MADSRRWFDAGERLFAAGDVSGAFDSYRRLLSESMQQRAPGATPSALDMVAMERLADLAALLGFDGPAEDILEAIQGWFAGCGNRIAADYAMVKLASVRIARGRLRQAYEALGAIPGLGDLDQIDFTDPGLEAFERGATVAGSAADRAVLFSRLYLEMGRILAGNGQYQSALASARRALGHCGREAPDLARRADVPLRLLQAAATLEIGDLAAAQEALDDPALKPDAAQPGFAIRAAELRGKAELLRGNLGAAKSSYETILDLCHARRFEAAEIRASLNLAHVLIYLNQTSRARELLSRAAAAARLRSDEALQVRAEYLLAICRSRAHSMAEGVAIAPSIFELWEQPEAAGVENAPPQWKNPFGLPPGDNFLALFEDRALGFHWHLASLAWDRAAAYLEELRAAFRSTDSQLIHLRLCAMQAMLAYYRSDFASAAAGFEQVCPLLEDAGLNPELWQAQRFLSWCWSRLGRIEPARAARAKADATLAGIANSLPTGDRAIFHLNKWTAEEEFAAGELQHLARARQRAAASVPVQRHWRMWKVARSMGSLLAHVDRFHAGLTQRLLETGSGPSANTSPSVARWLWGHGSDAATLRFVVLPDCVLVVRAFRFALDFGVCPVTRIQVREAVRSWHEAILEGRGIERANAAMQHLCEALQVPAMLAGLPERIQHLVIIPDDALYGLPFAAMRSGGAYLIERYAISIGGAPAAPKGPTPPHGTALAAGVATGMPGMEKLPGVDREIAEVSAWFRKAGFATTVLAEQEATADAVLRLLANAGVCHLACHGIFEPDSPDRSGLVLRGEDGGRVLSVRELSRLDLRGLRQIVLSSCWSADSFVVPGRWIISLPSILVYAGARSVVGSLWEVDDRLAREFMNRLYRRLETSRRDEALRMTQLDCLRGSIDGIAVADPTYWAGYTLYGAPGKLRAGSN